jgi:DNA (cytosine-5)-methyltransferase 1
MMVCQMKNQKKNNEEMQQTNIFELLKEKYTIANPIRLIELFAGIGSQAKALKNLNVNFEHYKIVEFDKYAIASYNAIHGTNFETQDITKIGAKDLEIVDTDKYDYILTYSFPCTDLSLAGDRKGMTKGSGTRSGLLWEVERLLDECLDLPQILLMENVPQVINKDFHEWQLKLESLGYSNYTDILNAKDFEIPQNRNRCFMVSILGDYSYKFPQKKKLKLRLKDLLEDEVDERYYLSDKMIKGMQETKFESYKLENKLLDISGNANTIIARFEGTPQCIAIPIKKDTDNYVEWEEKGKFDVDCRAWKIDKISPTIVTSDKTKILIPEATKKGYAEAQDGDGVYINRPQQKRGVVVKDTINLKEKLADDLIESGTVKGGEIINHSYTNSAKKPNSRLVLEDFIETKDGIMPTLTTRPDTLGVVTSTPLRIRKLTPKECWRLMGFDDEDFEKASKVNSNAQLYKQAGNSIVVNVLMAIFKEIL